MPGAKSGKASRARSANAPAALSCDLRAVARGNRVARAQLRRPVRGDAAGVAPFEAARIGANGCGPEGAIGAARDHRAEDAPDGRTPHRKPRRPGGCGQAERPLAPAGPPARARLAAVKAAFAAPSRESFSRSRDRSPCRAAGRPAFALSGGGSVRPRRPPPWLRTPATNPDVTPRPRCVTVAARGERGVLHAGEGVGSDAGGASGPCPESPPSNPCRGRLIRAPSRRWRFTPGVSPPPLCRPARVHDLDPNSEAARAKTLEPALGTWAASQILGTKGWSHALIRARQDPIRIHRALMSRVRPGLRGKRRSRTGPASERSGPGGARPSDSRHE